MYIVIFWVKTYAFSSTAQKWGDQLSGFLTMLSSSFNQLECIYSIFDDIAPLVLPSTKGSLLAVQTPYLFSFNFSVWEANNHGLESCADYPAHCAVPTRPGAVVGSPQYLVFNSLALKLLLPAEWHNLRMRDLVVVGSSSSRWRKGSSIVRKVRWTLYWIIRPRYQSIIVNEWILFLLRLTYHTIRKMPVNNNNNDCAKSDWWL